jgi:hypothetical protein
MRIHDSKCRFKVEQGRFYSRAAGKRPSWKPARPVYAAFCMSIWPALQVVAGPSDGSSDLIGSERKVWPTVALGDCEKRRRGCPNMGGGASGRGTRTRADVKGDFYMAGETSDVKRRGS